MHIERTQIYSEIRDVIIDTTKIQKNYEQLLYANKLDNLKEMDKLLET